MVRACFGFIINIFFLLIITTIENPKKNNEEIINHENSGTVGVGVGFCVDVGFEITSLEFIVK